LYSDECLRLIIIIIIIINNVASTTNAGIPLERFYIEIIFYGYYGEQ
jgi:hypothetical protein